jgi:hypothetical protein
MKKESPAENIQKGKAADFSMPQLLLKREKELARCGPSFPVSVDEPVQNFLLYGGDKAAAFLGDSLHAARDMVEWGRISKNNNLPKRVKTFMQDWHEKLLQEESHYRVLAKESMPYLLLDKGGEVRLRLPRQRIELPQEESRVTLELGGKCASSTPLNCRFLGENRVETLPLDLRLPCLEGVVPLTLMVGRQGVGFFEVQGHHDFKPYLAFAEDGRQIVGDELPRERLRLILAAGYRLESDKGLLGEQAVQGYEDAYTLYYLDLAKAAAMSWLSPEAKKKN